MSSPAESVASQTGEASPFNLSALDNDGIAFIGRSLLVGDSYERENFDELPSDTPLSCDDVKRDRVIRKFATAMGHLIDVEPDRAKALLKQAALSPEDKNNEMAMWCLEPLARRDFGLARDMYAYLSNVGEVGPSVMDGARDDIAEWATPEQVAELDRAERTLRDFPDPTPIPSSLLT